MLRARVITALFLVAGFLAVLFCLPAPGPALVFAGIAAVAAWEWAGLLKSDLFGRALFAAGVLLSCLLLWPEPRTAALAWLGGLAALFWLAVIPFWLKGGWPVAGAGGWAVGWLVIVPTWAALADLHARNPLLLLAVMALVWVADIAAYFTGRAWGRHKLAPAISPGKTWEGVGGALLGVLVYGLIVGNRFAEADGVALPLLAGFLLLLTALSVMGDLFESLAKRQAGLKDSGQLLPGHGGILDRIDSQTSTLPLVAFTLHWIGR